MKQPFLIGVAAVLIGLFGAATVLVILKPQDRPLHMPGQAQPENAAKQEPPLILTIGPAGATRVLHLALGDDLEADKRAYHAVRTTLETMNDSTLNLLPAMSAESPLHEAFAWALAAKPEGREDFIDGLMGTSGDITPQVLSLLAQNSGLDPTFLEERAKAPEVQQAMDQGHSVLPPSLPALFVNGVWLAGNDLTSGGLQENLGVAQTGVEESAAKLIVSDAYAFATPPTPDTAAVFLTLRNAGANGAKIVSVSTPVAGRAELHNMTMDDHGVMSMRRLGTLDVPANGAVDLNPHGMHIMLFDLPAPLAVGQSFFVTLGLQGGAEITARVEVVPPGTVLTHGPHSG